MTVHLLPKIRLWPHIGFGRAAALTKIEAEMPPTAQGVVTPITSFPSARRPLSLHLQLRERLP